MQVLAVRALGQTDLNPVSGVGKLSQIIFAGLSPGAIVPNVVAGAVAEAGAMQVWHAHRAAALRVPCRPSAHRPFPETYCMWGLISEAIKMGIVMPMV
eukprot:scaffold187257_cov35-Tisochrysis_lutea.AAC.2